MGTTPAPTSAPIRSIRRPATAPVAPCKSNPAGWDMDTADLTAWLLALRTCAQDCPMLRACYENRNRLYTDSMPAGVIWAGVAFTETGQPLTKYDLLAYADKLKARQEAEEAEEAAEVAALQIRRDAA